MDIMKLVPIIEKQTELQRKDNKIIVKLASITLQDITKEFAFEMLKLFVGKDSCFYDSLSIDKLTFVDPGLNGGCESLRYVYGWGYSLVHIFFVSYNKRDLFVSVNFLG